MELLGADNIHKYDGTDTNEEYNGVMYYVQDAIGKYWWVKADDIRYTKYSDLKIDLDDNVNKNIEFDLSKYSYEIRDGKLIIEEKKPKYPKTYKECRAMLDDYVMSSISGYKAPALTSLQNLLVCRNAYWKIAGEQMGLGKSWEPEWNHINRRFYCIYNFKSNIVKNVIYTENKILAFPTEEMRDAFYENFKDLIEQCKELL